jgi:HEAT repeat protein
MKRQPESQTAVLDEVPPVAAWLDALSHDSPFEPGQDTSVWERDAPRLALVPILISLLKDPDRDVRMRVVTALGNFGAQARQALPVLRAALKEAASKDSDESVRGHALRAVLQVGPEPASDIPALINALQSELEIVRFHAAATLGDLGRSARAAVPALIHAASWDEDAAVRVVAAVALWKIDQNGPLAVSTLVKALDGDNELVCWIAADNLREMGPEAAEAIPALRRALGRPFKIGLIRSALELALRRIESTAKAHAD